MHITEQQARQKLQALIDKYNALTDDQKRGMSESSVVRQFIDVLLRDVLGWPIEDPARYRYEQVTSVGRPDMMLTPESGGTIFLEAKRFGKIKELEEARTTIAGVIRPGQLALPGMAVDRTTEEQQAINYAFANNGTWAILTNFTVLRLFNARRDWLVLSFEKPAAYLQDFDLLWELAYHNVVAGSLDRLSNQRLVKEVDDRYLEFINEWRLKLAQDIVQQPEANLWAYTDNGDIDLIALRATVQRLIDRLVIVRFAEDHMVVTPGTLQVLLEARQRSYLFDLASNVRTLFRKFDENHNSALFSPGLADRAILSETTLLKLVEKLYEARYRSMPPDIMGNTYEQYLGKTLVRRNGSIETADNLETRKRQGSYYTPQVIVRYIVDNSLGRYLYATQDGRPDGAPVPGETRRTSADIRDLRVLDSACGSGSFLIYAYRVLADFYEREKERLQNEQSARINELARGGISDPMELRIQTVGYKTELERIDNYPRLILETHLYGVDLDPQAAEIAVVNLMMRGMERRQTDKRLPLILNQNVKVGNSLVGVRPADPRMAEHRAALARLVALRGKLLSTPHNEPEHDRIIKELAVLTAEVNATLSPALADHFSDPAAVHPLNWGVEFPEVFYDADGNLLPAPGFTVIIGNPPWDIVKPDLREYYAQFDPLIESRYNRAEVETRIEQLNREDPRRAAGFAALNARLAEMTAYVQQSPDYTRQGRGDVATHKLFLERSYGLLRHAGRIGYVVPSGIYTDLGTKPLREMLLNEGGIQYIFSFSNERFFFPGVHHSFKFTLLGAHKGVPADGFWSVFRFNPRVAVKPDDLPGLLADTTKLIYVRRESIQRFSPDSLSVMEFQSPRDYEIAEKLYGNWPLLGENPDGIWSIKLANEFHMTNDRDLFNTRGDGFPLYEGKMIHQYDAFYAEPQFWISDISAATLAASLRQQIATYRVAHRRIAAATNERTLIAAVVPPGVGCEVNATVVLTSTEFLGVKLFICALLNSFLLDSVIKGKISTTLNMFYLQQLPVPRLNPGNPYFDAIVPRAARLTCTRPEFADLWQSVMDSPWDASRGATDPAERQRLRDEIDALVARLYGLTRDEFDHILGTFPLVFPDTDDGRRKRAALLDTFDHTRV